MFAELQEGQVSDAAADADADDPLALKLRCLDFGNLISLIADVHDTGHPRTAPNVALLEVLVRAADLNFP
jgi:hypothetical protein